ncbi:helix-turn-helix domain-containing protein [Hymenobacter caeli]|uniref:Transcriptional regulator with XRE-family HTH domain n=1 Tax=Hymenobacter caeli TaxID=2735894 RepID=A0ABX2FQC9_9BACT|nr:helix-turn-helix domain-containing protein [Hymenobacter caeli]NRT19373.1 transcriptional regulator with XRE-family HTH domain [Hymenobacter caeli]
MNSIYDARHKSIVNRLTAIRTDAGISQTQLATALEIGQSDVSKVEQGQRRLDIVELVEWLAALEYDLFSFLSEVGLLVPLAPAAPVVNVASEFVPDPAHVVAVTGGTEIRLVGSGTHHDIVLANADIAGYRAVEAEAVRLFRSLNDGSLGLQNREAIRVALDFAIRRLPLLNPSDVYRHIIYRLYVREFSLKSPKQSWVRAGGEALELFIEDLYKSRLLSEGIEVEALIAKDRRLAALEEMGISDRVGAAKLDIALYGIHEGKRYIFGGLHVKASLAERVTDDVPCSEIMMAAGYFSGLWTFDAKDHPPRSLVNYGELGTSLTGKPTAKRLYIERDGSFSICFCYNTRTAASYHKTPSQRRIVVSTLAPDKDTLPSVVLAAWQDFKKARGLK